MLLPVKEDNGWVAARRRWSWSGGCLGLVLLCGAMLLVTVPPVDGYRLQNKESSCYYNGTHFMEGSIVPTMEPCLMCKCQSKTLICALKVCPEQPIPPPRGCILVHKSGSCCPYLQCSKLNLAIKNTGDRKKIHFLDYYEKAAEERFSNPNSYLRRSDDEEVEDNGACIVNGTVYRSGSAMVSSTLCSYCYCINGRQKCVKPKCALPDPGCTPIFIDSTCCPIRYDCNSKTPVKSTALQQDASLNHVRRVNNKHYQRLSERRGYRSNGCVVGGHTYPEGEKIKSEDPCEVCFCIRGQRKCTPKKCAPAIKGCSPRVPRGECCAVRYDCKHHEQKPFARKMEDEEESFDFFSILFGPDPDAPPPEAKNLTEPVVVSTEASPVSTTSEKSFLDFLRAGLDLIDDNADEDALASTGQPTTITDTIASTEAPVTDVSSEVQTVKVEIIQEPQAIYIEKPDFNFARPAPVPIRFKPLPKIPNFSAYQHLEFDSLLKENDTMVTPMILPVTDVSLLSTTEVPTTEASTVPSTISKTTIPPTTTVTRTTELPSTTTTVVITTTTATTVTSEEPTVTTDAPETTSVLPTTTMTVPSTTKQTHTTLVLSNSTATSKLSSTSSASAEVPSTTTTPITTVAATTDPAIALMAESLSTSPTPIDVVIKVNDNADKAAVASLLDLLNAKIENVTKATNAPTTVTTVTMKRPNNKFVGFNLAKVSPTVVTKAQTGVNKTYGRSTVPPVTESTTEVTTTETSTTEAVDSTTDASGETTVQSSSEEFFTTEETLETSEPTTSDDQSVEATSTTTESGLETTTDVTVTSTEGGSSDIELKTERDVEQNLTTTAEPPTMTTVKSRVTTAKPPLNPLKENNLLSVLLTGLSTIFDSTKNDSGKQAQRNRTEYRPVVPKPIPISGFHKDSGISSILESDINMDYSEATLPPSLPNLKIIPFLPADAVKKTDPPLPVKIAPPTYTYYKNNPNNFPIVNDGYEASYGLVKEHELHAGISYKNPMGKPINEYEYPYDPSINYPPLTENYEVDAKNNFFNTKVIRDKYDTIDEVDYDYENDPTVHKYDLTHKQELFQNELKKFIPTKYEVPQEGTYVPVYDKYGVGYPEKNVYYPNHKEYQASTESPLFRIDETDMSGFSPPTKTEGGFVPKEPIKDEFYYENYGSTQFPIELTTEDHHKLPYNATPSGSFGATPSNPFIDVIRTEPAPPLMTLIEDKEKLLSTLHTKNNSFEDDSADYEKQIISITTDANYLSTLADDPAELRQNTKSTSSKPNYTGFDLNFPLIPENRPTPEPKPNASMEPEPSGMFSLENMLNYLLREEDPIHENVLRNASTGDSTTPALADGMPPFKSLPSRLTAVYDPSTGIEASLGEVKPPSDDELHDGGTVTLKVESAKNDSKTLYRPSLMDLPFLNPGFHTKPVATVDDSEPNELDRYGGNYNPLDPDHIDQYQVISNRPTSNADSYVVNPVDINKLKQHHSEGTAEITMMKSKVKDNIGILKLAGCNIYGRMYRVGRIISELSGPCLECKCTEVGVHCTPLDCRRRR